MIKRFIFVCCFIVIGTVSTAVYVGVGMKGIENKAVNEVLKEYRLAKSGGDKIEICVVAGIVVAGYRQAKDKVNYLRFKKIQKRDCKAAGIPGY